MANVEIRNFEVGKTTGNLESARVSGRIYFSQCERDLNIQFRVRAILYEQDEGLDTFLPEGSSRLQIPRGSSDDKVGTIGTTYLRPDGQNSREFHFERTWNFPSHIEENRMEEYRAVVWAKPDIRGDVAVSSRLDMDILP